VRKLSFTLIIGLMVGASGCSSLSIHKTDARGTKAAKALGRAAVAFPTLGLSEVYYATR
jgi:uncharacterized protein YceK